MSVSSHLVAGVVGAAVTLAGVGTYHVVTEHAAAPHTEHAAAPQFGVFDLKVQNALNNPVSNPRHAVLNYQGTFAVENVQPWDAQGALPWIDVPSGSHLTEINTVDDDGRVLSCYNAFGQAPVSKCKNGVLIVVPAKVYDQTNK